MIGDFLVVVEHRSLVFRQGFVHRLLAYGCLALSMSLVGSYVALSKPLVAAIPVFLLAWLRFLIGAIAMLHWLPKPADEPPLTRRVQGLLFLESFLGNFLFSICMLYGVSMTTAVSAGVIMASIPAVVALLSRFALGEPLHPRTVAAIACAMLGMGLLAASPQGETSPGAAGGSVWLGNLLVFAAVMCEAAYAVIGKRLTATLGPRRITAVINLWGLVLATPLGLAAAWRFDFGSVAPGLWILLLFYALAASVWTVWLWMTGLRTIPASLGGVFTVMLPVSAAAIGVLILDEPLRMSQAAAFVLALIGVVLATSPAGAQRHGQR